MGVDLLLLAVIGSLLEGFVTAISGLVFNGVPTFTFSLLIVSLAVVRWNLWGLLLAPILALATVIGGGFNMVERYSLVYDWRIYISSLLGLLTVGLNVIFYKKYTTKKIVNNNWYMVLLVIMNYVTFSIVSFLMYRLLCSGTLAHSGNIPYIHQYYEEEQLVTDTYNLCAFAENAFVYNIFGLAVSIVGLFILRSQNVVNNVVDKLVEDKKNAELNRYTDEHFSLNLEETAKTDESSDTNDSPAN